MPEAPTLAPRRTQVLLTIAAVALIVNGGLMAWSSFSKDAHLDTCRAQAKTLTEMMEKSIASQKEQIETMKQQAATIATLKASLAARAK